MKNYSKIGKKALIEDLGKVGVVVEVDDNGNPSKVKVGEEIIDVLNLAVKIIGLLKYIVLEVKKWFK